jgi:C4-dicarboxylate transporter, DctQ subunit
VTVTHAAGSALRALVPFTLSAGILALAAITIANVLSRSVAARSLAWAEEASAFLVVWITFLGVAEAARVDRHVRMTALLDALSPAARRRAEIAIAATTAAFLLALAAAALDYVLRVASWGAVSPSLRVPLFLVYAAAPIGLAATALEYARIAFRGGVVEERDPPRGGGVSS